MNDQTPVKCTRCRFECQFSDLISRPRPRRSTSEIQMSDLVCLRCGCKSYYDCTPQVAWCWASGLIEIGDKLPDSGGAMQIAAGPKYALKGSVEGMARHGRAQSAGKLLVPGVPEAADQDKAMDALSNWLTQCNKRKPRDGVVFNKGGF